MLLTSSLLAISALTTSSLASPAQKRACDTSSLNTTTGSWPVTSTDTIYSIAASVNRGVCDIARANRMADATLMVSGEALVIPPQVCVVDNTSCLVDTTTNYTASCINGGPHTYTTVFNDTLSYIASKLEIAVSALTTNASDENTIIASGQTVKVPQCSPSSCTIVPFTFTYGTYTDLAVNYSTSVGQIIGFNPQYNYSSAAVGEGPVITLPVNCTALSGNVTVIS